jgi:DNA repair protein RAD5
MNLGPHQEPPEKKRRYFQDPDEHSSDPVAFSQNDDAPTPVPKKRFFSDPDDERSPNGARSALNEVSHNGMVDRSPDAPVSGPKQPSLLPFDRDTFESFVGDKVSDEIMDIIRLKCGSDLERAVNMFFDGTYKSLKKSPPLTTLSSRPAAIATTPAADSHHQNADGNERIARHKIMTRPRYLGSFGVEGWATRSSANLVKHGDVVRIERQAPKTQAAKAKGKLGFSTQQRGFAIASKRTDTIVRFTSQDGTEIGRLAGETAGWVSTLMDQKACKFEAVCVYAPEKLRTNDIVYLQLKCFVLPTAFENRRFRLADDRSRNPFEQDETIDEKELRLRQTALVKMMQEINLNPTKASEKAVEGRKGLLQAAEADEQDQKEQPKQNGGDSGGSPPSEEAEDGKELEQDQLDALYKKAQSFDFNTPEAEPPDTFAMTLRPYQKQSLHWMMAKEKDEKSSREPSMHPLWEEYEWPLKDADDKDLPQVTEQSKFYVNPYSGEMSLDFPTQEQHCLGGILADEMGLGKTIQMLSLIHSHKSDTPRRARPGANGLTSVNQLPRLATTSKTVVDAPHTTLVIAPMSLLSQWQSEAERASVEGSMNIELYYGNEKSNNLQALCSSSSSMHAPDLVITSYGVVLSEFSNLAAKNGDRSFHNGIFSLNFFRVILDEAHHIKNRASKTARACFEISAIHRWVLTGTPIVNRLEDLFSLVRFLGVEPWNNFSFWRTFITIPFEAGDFMRALDVVQTVLEPLVMRRTKDMKTPEGEPLVSLPPKHVEIVQVELSQPERDIYDYIYMRAKKTFSEKIEAGTVLKAYTTIFAQILRLRQSCCHPLLVRNKDIVADAEEAAAAADAESGLADDMDLETLIAQFSVTLNEASKDSNPTYGAHALAQIRDESEKECPLCFEEPMIEQMVTGCWHSACKKCLLDLFKHETDRGNVPKCFSCRAPLNKREMFEVMKYEDEIDSFTNKPRISLQRLGSNASSSKIAALMSELRAVRRDHPKMKSIIFSQFTSFMSLIEPVLTQANITFLRLDGATSQKMRAAVLQEFSESKKFTVLLLSLRAGGVGLNLTSAGRVFMMDPWWSFSVEAQAIDRVHRMGQEKEVMVKRFVVKGSVEERMLKVQERKKFM